jgi:tellurite resistance protein TerC
VHVSLLGWLALTGAIAALLAVDLFFAHRRTSMAAAAGWSGMWMAVGVAFGVVVLALGGEAAAGSYWAGFLMEKALSIDNVFVIAVLMTSFGVPAGRRADVLTFGIVGALVLRALFIVAGVTLIELFHPVMYVMGALLVATGIKIARSHDGGEGFAGGRLMRGVRRVLPHPLLGALLAVAVADVVFAIDSIPAVLAITTDTFIVIAANAFALLGLRALYFLLDGAQQRFEHLHVGLGVLLVFVGAKMLVEDWVHVPVGVSLGVIVATLGASLLIPRRRGRPGYRPDAADAPGRAR